MIQSAFNVLYLNGDIEAVDQLMVSCLWGKGSAAEVFTRWTDFIVLQLKDFVVVQAFEFNSNELFWVWWEFLLN